MVSIHGEKIGTWSLPLGVNHPSALAWSPDGRLMATVLSSPPRPDGSTTPNDARIRFVDMAGTGHTVPADLPYFNVLGWRSPTSIVVQDWLENENTDALVEVSTVDGVRTVLSRFTPKKTCEYGLQRCNAYRIQLATNLIPHAGIRPSNPDRGPLVPIVHMVSIMLAMVVVGGVPGGMVFLRHRRRRRATAVARAVVLREDGSDPAAQRR